MCASWTGGSEIRYGRLLEELKCRGSGEVEWTPENLDGSLQVANMQGGREAGWRPTQQREGLKIFRSAGVVNRLLRVISETG